MKMNLSSMEKGFLFVWMMSAEIFDFEVFGIDLFLPRHVYSLPDNDGTHQGVKFIGVFRPKQKRIKQSNS